MVLEVTESDEKEDKENYALLTQAVILNFETMFASYSVKEEIKPRTRDQIK